MEITGSFIWHGLAPLPWELLSEAFQGVALTSLKHGEQDLILFWAPAIPEAPALSMLFSPSLLCPQLALTGTACSLSRPLAAPPSSPCCPLASIVPSCLDTLPVSFACQSPTHLSRDSSKIASSG